MTDSWVEFCKNKTHLSGKSQNLEKPEILENLKKTLKFKQKPLKNLEFGFF